MLAIPVYLFPRMQTGNEDSQEIAFKTPTENDFAESTELSTSWSKTI